MFLLLLKFCHEKQEQPQRNDHGAFIANLYISHIILMSLFLPLNLFYLLSSLVAKILN